MATSPTPSLDSIRGTNSIESYGEHNGYLSDSPLTLSGSSPPVSDSVICDEFTSGGNSGNQHHPISASVSSSSSASSSSSSSGVSVCGSSSSSASSSSSNNGDSNSNNNSNANSNGNTGPGVIGSNLNNNGSSGKGSPCSGLIAHNNVISLSTNNPATAPRCTACKSKQSDAVAKCFECISFLCANCVTAHQFMHCFNGHNVCLIKGFDSQLALTSAPTGVSAGASSVATSIATSNTNTITSDFKLSSSLTMMLQQQQQQHHHPQQQQQLHHQHQQLQKQQPLSQLSKIVLNSHAAAAAAAAASVAVSIFNDGGGDHSVAGHHERSDDAFSDVLPTPLRSNNLFCHRHKHELLKFSCRTCCTLACKECVVLEHSSAGLHEVEHVQQEQIASLGGLSTLQSHHQSPPDTLVQSLLDDLRGKVGEIVSLVGNSDNSVAKVKMHYQKAHNEVNETYQFFCSMLDERKQEVLKELESLYNAKINSNNLWLQRSKELIEKSVQTCDAMERAPKAQGLTDMLLLRKTLDMQLHAAMQDMQLPLELEFMSNYQSIQAGVRNTFGYIRATDNNNDVVVVGSGTGQKQPPIARPTQSLSNGSGGSNNSNGLNGGGVLHLPTGLLLDNSFTPAGISSSALLGRSGGSHVMGVGVGDDGIGVGVSTNANAFDDLLSKQYQSSAAVNIVAPFGGVAPVNPYEKWSNGGTTDYYVSLDPFHSPKRLSTLISSSAMGGSSNGVSLSAINVSSGGASNDSLMDLTSKLLSASIYPPKSQIKRQKMIYHCKFGEFGVMEGQFTEPSGVAVNAQNDIIVADTNNHRIQIFDKEGRFKFQFGECGKRDSQLLYPNRVAVVRTSGDIIVTERSPTHQIQIYNQYGQFVRKFGANILQHPRGVTVDHKGRIIVVECKVMRVIIFDQNGNVLHKFGCSKHLEFPNGVVVNDKEEIFISDNRAHCVKVFNYEGQYLRQIGGEGVTNYPIGVGINANGEILIADNHNNFNLTIFTQDGQLVSALESKVKHAQCFDVALMDDGSVVLASKDYRLYIYRYVQVPPIGL